MHELFLRIMEDGLSVREAEALARETPVEEELDLDEEQEEEHVAPRLTDPHVEEVTRRLRDNLGTKVVLMPKSKGGGTIHITYHDAEELDRLLAKIAPRQPRSYIRLSDTRT